MKRFTFGSNSFCIQNGWIYRKNTGDSLTDKKFDDNGSND